MGAFEIRSLLRLMAQGEGGARLSDLARAAGLPVSTAHRLLTAAAAHDLTIIEDDIFGDFEPEPSPRLAALDGLYDLGIQNVVCRHEGGAAFAACGWTEAA